jgi:hypothetical protein
MILLLAACADETAPPAAGFHIVGSTPEDGEPSVIEAQIPELRFSAPIDVDLCTADTLQIVGLFDDGSVAFHVDLEVLALDEGSRVQLTHEVAFPTGWMYALSASSGASDGCFSRDGEPLEPFSATFGVQ